MERDSRLRLRNSDGVELDAGFSTGQQADAGDRTTTAPPPMVPSRGVIPGFSRASELHPSPTRYLPPRGTRWGGGGALRAGTFY